MKIRKVISGILAIVVLGCCVVSAAENDEINPQFIESERIERMKNLGIMVGNENGDFETYRILTRAELAKIAVKMSEPYFWDYVEAAPQIFVDVDDSHWAYYYIQYAVQAGIMRGYEDGSFGADSAATVQEAVKVMVTVSGYSPQAEVIGGYPDGYIKTASRIGITEGISVKMDESIARNEMAEIAARTLDIPMMIEGLSGEYIICDGLAQEHPLLTLAIKNFKE